MVRIGSLLTSDCLTRHLLLQGTAILHRVRRVLPRCLLGHNMESTVEDERINKRQNAIIQPLLTGKLIPLRFRVDLRV